MHLQIDILKKAMAAILSLVILLACAMPSFSYPMGEQSRNVQKSEHKDVYHLANSPSFKADESQEQHDCHKRIEIPQEPCDSYCEIVCALDDTQNVVLSVSTPKFNAYELFVLPDSWEIDFLTSLRKAFQPDKLRSNDVRPAFFFPFETAYQGLYARTNRALI